MSTPIAPSREAPCPCGSVLDYLHCCRPFHQGEPAPTPEALMRSRYSAFALDLQRYVLDTWHASTRPDTLPDDPDTQWMSLNVLAAPLPASMDDQAVVHFRAYFRERSRWHALEEVSRFVKQDERWWYVDGSPSVQRVKPSVNAPCLCGSGRKLKLCCKK